VAEVVTLFDVRLLRSMRLADGSVAVRGSLLRLPGQDAARLIREGLVILASDAAMPALLRCCAG